MKVMITGFDPFGGENVNPAFEAVKKLPEKIAGAEVIKLEVPTVFDKAGTILEENINKEKPDIVICVGQAGGRSGMTVEKVAINFIDARIPDNEGNQPLGRAIKEDGEIAYFATIPIKSMVEKMREKGIPAFLSYTAGTFVCNDLMYHLLYLIDKKFPEVKGGFIHVPYAPAQTIDKPLGTPSMSIDMITDALEASVEAAIAGEECMSIGGSIH